MDELDAFLTTLLATDPDAPTRCPGWTAHDLLAHLVAGTEEMLRLCELALQGDVTSPTRPFDEREVPWRARPDPQLRTAFIDVGGRLLAALGELSADARVPFTGWCMTPTELRVHARSELVLHRWDFVGDDAVGRALLDQADLVEHGRKALINMPTLREARRVPTHDDDLLDLWGRGRHRPEARCRPT